MLRDVAYVYRRRRIPWALSKERRGYQINDVGGAMIHAESWDQAVANITASRVMLDVTFAKFSARQAQVAAFKNPARAYHFE